MTDSVKPASVEFLTEWATLQGLSYSPERLTYAQVEHARMRAELEALRAVPLSYVEPVIEPATALAWLENGGRS